MNKPFERIKRRIAASLALISIILCAITVILWPLSYATGIQFSIRNGAGTRYALLTLPGHYGFATVKGEPRGRVTIDGATQSFGSSTYSVTHDMMHWFWQPPTQSSLGFASTSGLDTIAYPEVNASFKSTYKMKLIPIWLIALVTFAGPMGWYKARRRRQFRMENELCVYCGSDMTASPYRCPACGREQQW